MVAVKVTPSIHAMHDRIVKDLLKKFGKFYLNHKDAQSIFGVKMTDEEFNSIGVKGIRIGGIFMVNIYVMATVFMADMKVTDKN
ncbi:TPA: hypothetical protein QDC20_006356 [Burkholderia aenigmatica]|uniref:hypothetical protein n=1 Tax=Burkholderia sp. AU45251 TaxID=3059204 RepID=UPI00264E8D02|nr:hypothetical protein [Burkholderia sp. AU45251]HDR9482907.1 hypothetical protein [Burkholderia aenigmatica]MDN7520576.1 hypothetical protein [Burkholderia sp. AU45251]HDR9513854.1 hypothetical protein [Burkholderia aenigmatica]HDR9591245.1 hypothetical protein [Burkholderia aenigmatica]HDR9599227.1 hypothetical protein [Burkholderia aenigmatica]